MTTDSTHRRLLRYAYPYLKLGILGTVATISYAAIDAGFVYLLEPLLNEGFIAHSAWHIQWMPIIIFCMFVVRGISSFVSSLSMTWIARSIVMTMRQQLFEQLLVLKAEDYSQGTSGDLLSKLIYDSEQVAQVSVDALTTFLQSLGLIVGLFVVMFSIHWQLTLIYIAVVPIIALMVRWTNKRIRRYSHDIQRTMGLLTETAQETIMGYREIRIFSGQTRQREKFEQMSHLNRDQDMRVAKARAINISGAQLIAATCIAYIVHLIMDPQGFSMSAGSFSAMIAAMLAMLKPLKNFTTVNSSIQRGLAGAQSIFNFLDQPHEPNITQTVKHPIQGEVVFKQVSFCYPGSHEKQLNDINLTIEPGQNIAIVGHSGSGKSTLVSLLPRFFDTTGGHIELDGADIRSLSLLFLRHQIALVSQQIMLFNDTVANNITYGQSGQHHLNDIKSAAQLAQAWSFIETLPKGLDTIIGENGTLLSGGQRQRLAIARAAYKKAPLLILDEATSALDTESERLIQTALQQLMSQCTSLVIAHRLSTIKDADHIVVLHQGRIVEQGCHRDLYQNQGHYTRLYQLQYSGHTL